MAVFDASTAACGSLMMCWHISKTAFKSSKIAHWKSHAINQTAEGSVFYMVAIFGRTTKQMNDILSCGRIYFEFRHGFLPAHFYDTYCATTMKQNILNQCAVDDDDNNNDSKCHMTFKSRLK